MSRRLNPNELVCFGFPHFDCEARYLANPIQGDIVEVTILMYKGTRYRFLCNHTLTLDEIKELTAYRMVDLLQGVCRDVAAYASDIRKATCPQ